MSATAPTPANWLLARFRRITSSGVFFPEIDGLRFLAITCVVLYHINGYVAEKTPHFAAEAANSWLYGNVFNRIFSAGFQGVCLFFVISGFILGYPSVREHLGLGRRPSYGNYLKRRLTRLEPPYILSTVVLFLALVFVLKKDSFASLWPSLLASLSYTHNLFFPYELPRVNSVLWSLEIEVQFYLVAPALCRLYFLAKNPAARRILGLVLMEAWAWFSRGAPGLSIVNYGYFFLCGIVLCDLVASKGPGLKAVGTVGASLAGAVLLGVLLAGNFMESESRPIAILFPLLTFAFYLIVLVNPLWKRVFSNVIIVLIGGMCYSIYLLHFAIISMVGRCFIPLAEGWNFGAFFSFQIIACMAAILAISACYYKCVERPCMRREWPSELMARIRRLRGGK